MKKSESMTASKQSMAAMGNQTRRVLPTFVQLCVLCALCVWSSLPHAAFAAAEAAATEGPPPRPAVPAIVELKLIPDSLTLEDGRDARSVLVLGKSESGDWFDLTDDAKMATTDSNVRISEDRYIEPVAAGDAKITIEAEGRTATLPVTIKSASRPPVRFVRDIQPIVSKVGCNSGTCHGAAKGKNGFQLSLRGYDSDFDYIALVEDLSGRRFNRAVPSESLMLLKPTGGVPHEGGRVLDTSSRYYSLMHEWIASGLKPEVQAEGRATKIEVLPAEINLALAGMTQRLLVIAHYPDGSTRDVTREAVFTAGNIEVAAIKENSVAGIRRGEAAILVRYEGNYATAPMSVMGDRAEFAWAETAELNYIDTHINSKLQKMKILPSELCDDAEFMRRVSLDLTGIPPTPERARAFVNDPAPSAEKRAALVDELIGSEPFIEYWTNKWADLLQCNSTKLGEKGVWVFRNWIRESVAANTPYDTLVREILLAQGSGYEKPAANYYRVLRDTDKMTEDISQTFLGVRFTCAKCHDHPFEPWTQNQYYQFGAFFSRVGIKPGRLADEEVVYTRFDGGEVMHPKKGTAVEPKVPFSPTPEIEELMKDQKRREAFVEWLASAENPIFAKAITNRIWSFFFSRGIIEPVDDIRASNPPSNPALLDALTKDFIESKFDLRHLMKTICASRAYQASIKTNKWNEDDKNNFSHQTARRLSAEQLLDAIALATETQPKLGGSLPAGMRAVEAPDGMIAGNEFLTLFGRPSRKSSCACERTSNLSLAHALNLINGETISDAVAAPGNRIAKIIESEPDDARAVETIFYAVLNRPPSQKEIASITLSDGSSRVEAAQDLAWALMNSPSFLYNR